MMLGSENAGGDDTHQNHKHELEDIFTLPYEEHDGHDYGEIDMDSMFFK